MPKATETILEIDLNALESNFRYLASKISSETKILAVVKAYGYGSDSIAIAKELELLNVDYLAVAYTKEGTALRDSAIETPIIVLHPLPMGFDEMIDRCLEPSIYSKKILDVFISLAETKKQNAYPIHLKFNTGLNRLGFNRADIPYIIDKLSNTKSVRAKSIFSHLAASEDLNEKDFTKRQIGEFRIISEEMISKLGYRPLLHCTNTSGIVNFPEAHFDMVRTGIGLYGYANSDEENKHLKPVGTLKTVISQIHIVEKGESIGYNRGFFADRTIRSATLPIGHADGIPRSYGKGKGWVTINGQKAPILGNVCMDMIMVDVTDIDCEEGEEAIVFGPNATADKLAAASNTISYELITAVSQRVKRLIRRNKERLPDQKL